MCTTARFHGLNVSLHYLTSFRILFDNIQLWWIISGDIPLKFSLTSILFSFSAIWFFCTVFAVIAIVAAAMLFYFYAIKEECTENKIFVGVNAGLCFLICFISILPCTVNCRNYSEIEMKFINAHFF